MLLQIVILLVASSLPLMVCEGITLTGAKCGVKTCQWTEYCSNYDRICQSCEEVCNSSHHNYEESVCEKQCQNYLHDLRYVTQSGKLGFGSNDNDLRETVAKLSRMITVTLTLVCLMLIVLAGFLSFQFYRWKEKKNITLASLKEKFFGGSQNPENNSAKTNNLNADNKKPDLRLEIPTNGSHSDHSPVTLSTSISRRPAEDSTLDYAYDNPAMASPR